jgi:starch-binding outer membrane protein, SusD/RagB family
MTKHRLVPLAAGLALFGAACDRTPTVPNLNNPSVEDFAGTLTNDKLQVLLVGVLSQERTAASQRFYSFTTTLGRDSYRLDTSESRFLTETLESTPAAGGFVGGGLFTDYYVAVRASNNLLGSLNNTPELSANERTLVKGFVETLKAQDLFQVAQTRDTIGIPVAVDDPKVVAPILCKKDALAAISTIVDAGYTDLQAAGTATIPVKLPSGFTSVGGDFRTAANLIKYNRGLAGKILTYRAILLNSAPLATQAIAALNIAIGGDTVTQSDLNKGPYFQYSTASGETSNPLFDNKLHLNPHVADSIVATDLRRSKIDSTGTGGGAPFTQTTDGVVFSTKYDYFGSRVTNGANQTRPNPVLRTAELILLRAQAKVQAGDLVGATADANIVRRIEGGAALVPYAPFASSAAAINAILYEKRYSLLFEGPQRWVDLRAYGLLNSTSFTLGGKSAPYLSDPFTASFPIPQAEKDARDGNVTKTCT